MYDHIFVYDDCPNLLLSLFQINWAILSSALVWTNSGWDSLGNFAGEVHNPSRTYPLGIALAMGIGTVSYLVSVVVSYTLLPDPALWNDDGAFVVAAMEATGPGTWLPLYISIGAVLANLGQLMIGMAATSRMMWAMGAASKEEGIAVRTLPKFVGRIWPRFNTPISALIVQLVVTSIMSIFDFKWLLQFLALLNCMRLCMEFVSFWCWSIPKPMSIVHSKYLLECLVPGA